MDKFFYSAEYNEIFDIYSELDEKITENDEYGIPETEPSLFILKYRLYIVLYSYPSTRIDIFNLTKIDLNDENTSNLVYDLIWAYNCFDNQKSSNKIINCPINSGFDISIKKNIDCEFSSYEFWSFYYSRIKRKKQESFDTIISEILTGYISKTSIANPNVEEVELDLGLLDKLSCLAFQISFFSCSTPGCINKNCKNREKENNRLKEIINSIS